MCKAGSRYPLIPHGPVHLCIHTGITRLLPSPPTAYQRTLLILPLLPTQRLCLLASLLVIAELRAHPNALIADIDVTKVVSIGDRNIWLDEKFIRWRAAFRLSWPWRSYCKGLVDNESLDWGLWIADKVALVQFFKP